MCPIENAASRTREQSHPSATCRWQKTSRFLDESSLAGSDLMPVEDKLNLLDHYRGEHLCRLEGLPTLNGNAGAVIGSGVKWLD